MKPARYQPLAIASRRSREARRRTATSYQLLATSYLVPPEPRSA